MKYTYIPQGVCSTKVDFCNGNLKAISALVEGMPVDEVTKKLSGISCGMKSTSCTDQLATALKKAVEKSSEGAGSESQQ